MNPTKGNIENKLLTSTQKAILKSTKPGTIMIWRFPVLLFAILSISFVRNQIPQNVKVNSLGCVTSGMYSGWTFAPQLSSPPTPICSPMGTDNRVMHRRQFVRMFGVFHLVRGVRQCRELHRLLSICAEQQTAALTVNDLCPAHGGLCTALLRYKIALPQSCCRNIRKFLFSTKMIQILRQWSMKYQLLFNSFA